MNGLLHWVSKHQSITARSSAEAEIYEMDKCVKALLHINSISEDLGLREVMMSKTTCVHWTHNMTSKKNHLQMRENAVQEAVQTNFTIDEHDG
eukprot:2879299-Ditylum_brightwellii.AAC.1